MALIVSGLIAGPSRAQEGAATPSWIWHRTPNPAAIPAETRYFRKAFRVKEPSKLVIDVTADDSFRLFLDGREVASGNDWHAVKGVEARLATGEHVLAAVVANEAVGSAGLLVRGGVLPLGQNVPVHTDSSWRSSDKVPPGQTWLKVEFDDSTWWRAQDIGPLGVGPWRGLVFESGDASATFKVPEGFTVRQVAGPGVTGSTVAFTFDDRGRPCVSIERGPIARLVDADGDGKYEDRKVIAPRMNNCQGFSFIRGALYAVGNGPEKAGIYRLTDRDGDGVYESTEVVRLVDGVMAEHGPHAIALGPDGCLYFNSGNHAHLKPPIDPKSPANIAYEGELLPHYNDSRGHAVGIMAPCGEIYRSADEGKTWERIASGFRNHYDFAINRDGEVFTFDSDMEWDIGLPWYRPVRVLHATIGAEFGSRNGSGVWPAYFYDSLPSTLDVGRGSPTGVTFYQGTMFPREFDDNLLACDWSQGRILAVRLKPDGASYKATEKELVGGQPLNCTDIEVGPDGAVYFSTGGRGTLGGLYRVAWAAADRPRPKPSDDPLTEALEIASPLTSTSQRRLAEIKQKLGRDWSFGLTDMARRGDKPLALRRRALDLLATLGPLPEDEILIDLTHDKQPAIRARAVTLLGLRPGDRTRPALTAALADPDALVCRRACEAIVRARGPIPVEALVPLLRHPDRWVRTAARVAIEHADLKPHRALLLSAKGQRARLGAMMALVRASKLDDKLQDELLDWQLAMLKGSLPPEDLLELTRLIGLTYLLGPRPMDGVSATAEFRRLLGPMFPVSGDPQSRRNTELNRELARLLAYFNDPTAVGKVLELQAADPDRPDQIHYAYCLRAIRDGWTPEARQKVWAWFESASRWDGGFSYLGYLDFMVQDVLARFTPEVRDALLSQAVAYPFPTRVLVRAIDLNERPEKAGILAVLYSRLDPKTNPNAVADLRSFIIDALGRSTDPQTHASLRTLAATDPTRRDQIARALAQHPAPEDLPVFVSALESRDANTTGVVLDALTKLQVSPEGPEALRNLIRLARRTGPSTNDLLNSLASRWTGTTVDSSNGFEHALKSWEALYAERFPSGPPLADSAAGQNEYTLQQLMAGVLQSGLRATASAERGKQVIAKAKCLDCHKLGDQGQGLGPDLTTVWSRFRPHEILESIVEPSKVISDQYKSITVATSDGKVLNGMPTGMDPNALVLLLSDGTKVTVPKADVEEQKDSKVSVMPEGLVNVLSLREIADLMALFEAQPRVEEPKSAPKP